jgi:uncharacterized protein (DUF305 family)
MKAVVTRIAPLLACLVAGCGSSSGGKLPGVVQPGAPGQASAVVTAGAAAKNGVPQATEADIRFMQGMIHHHAQALDMTELIDARTNDPDMKKLGLRIHVSQTDEITMMQRWLQVRGQEAPDPRAHHGMAGMAGMAGMEGMDHTVMIKHHEGALTMVKELFATPGAGQQSEIFAFASDVEADQKMEIDRMTAMLKERTK